MSITTSLTERLGCISISGFSRCASQSCCAWRVSAAHCTGSHAAGLSLRRHEFANDQGIVRSGSPTSPFDQPFAHQASMQAPTPLNCQAAHAHRHQSFSSISPGRNTQLSVQIPELMTDATAIEGGGGVLRLSPAMAASQMSWPCAPTGNTMNQPQYVLRSCPWQHS